MKIRTLIFLWVSLFVSTACGPNKMYLEVTVLDSFTEAPLDSAHVELFRSAIGTSQQTLASCVTNESGTCILNIEVEEAYQYWVESTRSHYVNPVSEDGSDYLHKANLEPSDTQRVELRLESILPPDLERFEKMYPQVPISQVVAAIQADEWSWTFLPKIQWADIPILLNLGNDSTFIQNYPSNRRSRYRPDSVRAGLVSLWLIEALRKQQHVNNGNTDGFYSLVIPSRAPVLGTRKGNPSGFNSTEQIQTAYEAYKVWWEEMPADSTLKAEKIRQNPLEGKGLSWM